jgi:tetratricopeptide (TPR) repeat protein
MNPSAPPPDRSRLLRWLSSLVSLSAELRRRKVVQVALMYLGGALVTLAAAETVVETYGLPESTRFIVGIAVLLGFPPAVILAWAFDWTDDGIRRSTATRVPSAVRRGVMVGAILLVAGAGGLAAIAVLRAPARPAANEPVVLSVLPFEAAEAELKWMATSLQAGIETALAGIPGLTLIPAHAAAPYPDLPRDTLAQRLGADFFLHATVTGGGSEVELHIIDGPTQSISNARTVSVPAGEDALMLAASLATGVETSLRRVLGREVELRTWNRGTTSAAASEARYRADVVLERAERLARIDRAGFAREMAMVDSLLRRAGRLDPRWREVDLARAAAREVEALAVAVHEGAAAAVLVLDKGITELDAVLEAAPDHSGALAARGQLRWKLYNFALDDGRPDAAAALLDQAAADLETAARDPALASAAATLAELHTFGRGDFQLAHEWATQAYQRDAFLENRRDIMAILAQASLELNRDADAARWCRQLEAAFPEFAISHGCALEVMAWGGDTAVPDSAWAAYERILARFGGPPTSAPAYYGYAVAAVLARAGLADSARAVIGRLSQLRGGPGTASDNYWLEAAVRFRLDEEDRARELVAAFLADHPHTAASIQSRRALRDYLTEPVLLEGR